MPFQPFEIHEDIAKAWTPPGAFYTYEAAYEAAKERVFVPSWQFLGDLDAAKVPGQATPFTILEGCLDEPVVLTRDANDQIHLVSNVCTHRGMLVVEGACNERFLRCRYHGRRFGMDGRFQHMPEFEGVEGFPCEKDHLAPIPRFEWSKLLFASIRPSHSAEDVLRPMLDRVGWMPLDLAVHEPTQSRDYIVNANWALYVENYLEGFHIPFVHASLNSVIDYGRYAVELHDHCSVQIAYTDSGGDVFDLPESSPDFGQSIAAYYFWVFPNLMFNFYPWGLSVNVVRPLGPSRTKVSFIRYVWDASRLGTGAGDDVDRVEREDEAIVEAVQKGLRSRIYERGRYSVARETGTHHFHRLLTQALFGG
ncbi:MAG: hypothetical protein AMXMBFR81_12300 [Chthonomonas sp.]